MVNKEVFKQLIESGFDIESISFEFDVPMKEMKKIQGEIKKEETKKVKPSKMEALRQRYQKLYLGDNHIEIEQVKELSPEERKLVNSTIKKIEEEKMQMQGIPKEKRKSIAYQMIKEIDEISQYSLDIQQIEKICQLLQAEDMKNLNTHIKDRTDFILERKRREMTIRFVEAINIAQAQTESIEELKHLNEKLITNIMGKYHALTSSVNTRINNKIMKLAKQEAINKLRNNIPTRVQTIVTDIANGTLNIEEAKQVIEEEANKQVQNNPNNKFSLTTEQQRNKIYMQIRDRLMENPEEYVIQNPEVAITQLQELCRGDLQQAIRAVTKNLIGRKEFEQAKDICKKYSRGGIESEVYQYMRILRKEIRDAEVSDMVLKGIHMQGTIEKENKYFEFIERGLNSGNIDLKTISLGKTKDESRTITLQDIWTDKNEKNRG